MLLPAPQHVDASAFTWPAALFLWGPGSWSDLHRHHCVQVVMALRGTLRFRQRQRQRWTTCGAVLVRSDAWHEVNARGADVLIAFVDAESELGAALAERTASEVAPIPSATVAEWRTQLGDPATLTAARVEPWVTRTLLYDRRPPPIDYRVKRVLRALPSRLAEAEAVSLDAVAAVTRAQNRIVNSLLGNAFMVAPEGWPTARCMHLKVGGTLGSRSRGRRFKSSRPTNFPV